MKKIIISSLLIASFSALAMDGKQLKEAALKACDTQAEQMPENVRAQVKKTCLCSVNKTDYDALMKAQASGKMEEIQAEALKVAQECAAEAL